MHETKWSSRGKRAGKYDILAWVENKIAKIYCLTVSYLGTVFDRKIMIKKMPLKSSKKNNSRFLSKFQISMKSVK